MIHRKSWLKYFIISLWVVAGVVIATRLHAVADQTSGGEFQLVSDTVHAGVGDASEHETHVPSLLWTAPFVALLLCIALLPLIPATAHWWHKNSSKLLVAVLLGGVTLIYYYTRDFGFPHRAPTGEIHYLETGWTTVWAVLDHAIVVDYIPFIVLLFSLYVCSGGINLAGDIRATPLNNTILIAIGTVLANFIGTTGAAMLLIRPLLQINQERRHVRHTVIFFIFLCCNIGGSLLPIGDPPLFLGYLRGVDFLWTLHLFPEWLVMSLTILAVYFVWDTFAYKREKPSDLQKDRSQIQPLRLRGGLNFVWLVGIVLSVALLAPEQPFLGLAQTTPGGETKYRLDTGDRELDARLLRIAPDMESPPNQEVFVIREEYEHTLPGPGESAGVVVYRDGRREPITRHELDGDMILISDGFRKTVLTPAEIRHVSVAPRFFNVPMFMREIVMLLLVLIAWLTTSPQIRAANNFNFEAIGEVACLFIGIFVAMQVPLEILNLRGDELPLEADWQFFWMTGTLSAFLDNAPTYVVFLQTAVVKTAEHMSQAASMGQAGAPTVMTNLGPIEIGELTAISVGSVFMGALTYIGNGPNFMVKSIAESAGVKMPSFFGYMAYSCGILIPALLIITWLFFV